MLYSACCSLVVGILLTFQSTPQPQPSPPPAAEQEEAEEPAPARKQRPSPAFAEFVEWAMAYVTEDQPDRRETLVETGVEIAKRRRQALMQMIVEDPQQALELSIPASVRHQLPPEVQTFLGEIVSGKGRFDVIAKTPMLADQTMRMERFITLGDRIFRAQVYGRRTEQATNQELPVHGIAIGDQLAVHHNPVRILDKAEVALEELPIANKDMICPVTGEKASPDVAVDAGGEIYFLQSPEQILEFEKRLIAEEEKQSTSPAVAPDMSKPEEETTNKP